MFGYQVALDIASNRIKLFNFGVGNPSPNPYPKPGFNWFLNPFKTKTIKPGFQQTKYPPQKKIWFKPIKPGPGLKACNKHLKKQV